MRIDNFTLLTFYLWVAQVARTAQATPANNKAFNFNLFKDMGNITVYMGCGNLIDEHIGQQYEYWRRNFSPRDADLRRAYAYSIGLVKFNECFERFYLDIIMANRAQIESIKMQTCDGNLLKQLQNKLEAQFRITYYIGTTLKRFIQLNESEYGKLVSETGPFIPSALNYLVASRPAPLISGTAPFVVSNAFNVALGTIKTIVLYLFLQQYGMVECTPNEAQVPCVTSPYPRVAKFGATGHQTAFIPIGPINRGK